MSGVPGSVSYPAPKSQFLALFFSQLGCFIKLKEKPRLPAMSVQRQPVFCGPLFTMDALYGIWHHGGRVCLLRYLLTAKGIPVGERWIAFRKVLFGPLYHDASVRCAVEGQNWSLGSREDLERK